MFPLSKKCIPSLFPQKERKKPVPYSPCQFKKYTRLSAILWSACVLLMTLSALPIQAQDADKTIDPVDAEFSGPLAVVPEMVPVGDPGNAPDPATGLGAVQEPYQTSKYVITRLQWATFLSAVHVIKGNLADQRGLYREDLFEEMGLEAQEKQNNSSQPRLCSLTGLVHQASLEQGEVKIEERKVTLFFPHEWGTPKGRYYASLPMTGLSINNCKRYINWLHHGSPFLEDLSETSLAVTETGAYDFTHGKNGELMEGARYFLPSLDQWYKAAYYKGGSTTAGYWSYPTQGDQLPRQTPGFELWNKDAPKTGANYAEIGSGWAHLKFYYVQEITNQPLITPVGTFQNSPGVYGTYDMGGNVRQWTSDFVLVQDLLSAVVLKRQLFFVAPGGSYDETSDQLKSSQLKQNSLMTQCFNPSGDPKIGLRVCALASMPTVAKGNPIPQRTLDNIPPEQDKLLRELYWNILKTQVEFYGLELAMNAYRIGAIYDWRLIEPFTLQRNITNFILTIVNASAVNAAAHTLNIKKADFWNISYLVIATAASLTGTEIILGAAVEYTTGYLLELIAPFFPFSLTIAETAEGWTWQRILINVAYISLNTESTVLDDLKYFNEQQKKIEQAADQNNQ